MSQEKIEIIHLPGETLHQILDYAAHDADEESQANIVRSHSIFGHNPFRTDRILAKLSKYIAEAKLDRITKLLEIRPDLAPKIPSLLQQGLFALAGFAEQDKMEAILKFCPQLFFTYAPLKDISGVYPVIKDPEKRGITVFQHAVWTGDMRYMCNMMLDCIPQNEEGEKIRIELLRQYNELMAKGVVYKLDGEMHEEKQFNLQKFIETLQGYIDKPYEERKAYWCTTVGLAQARLPAIVRHHYCDPEENYLIIPNFCKPKLKRSLNIYNWIEEEIQVWDDSLSGLGSTFAIVAVPFGSRRGNGRDGMPGGGWEKIGCSSASHFDSGFLKALVKVRAETYQPALIERLQSPIQSQEEIPTSGI